MQDRRQNARDKVIYGGVADIGETGASRDCIVRDISEHGARVEFSNVVKFPKEQISLTIALLLVPLMSVFLFRTKWGLRLRAVGEKPRAADTVGLPVIPKEIEPPDTPT